VCSNSGREPQKLQLYDQIFGKEFNLGFHQPNQRLSRACIVHLVMKRTNWSYVKTMSCSGSHLGIPINIREENISVFSHMVPA
jgi:hypothetical protein